MRFIIVCCFIFSIAKVSAQHTFNNLDEALNYAATTSITAQTNTIKLLQAKKAKIAAVASIPDVTASGSTSLINNTQLPVSLFPSEFLGGEPGTFQQVQTGVQYNTSVLTNLDVKLINVEGWQNLKLANLNLAVSETDNKLNIKSLYENIASAYYNVLQLQAQLNITKKSLFAADTLLQIAENKYNQGLVKQQDVNDSRINRLKVQGTADQLKRLLELAYIDLKILCDIPEAESISVVKNIEATPVYEKPSISDNLLSIESSRLRERYEWVRYKKVSGSLLPTLSFIGSNNYNQYNQEFTVFGGDWIRSTYFGIRLAVTLPNAKSISDQVAARYDHQLAAKSLEQALIKTELEQQQLEVNYQKAFSEYVNKNDIYLLQVDTYRKNKSLYMEGLLGIDQTLTSFTNAANSEYDLVSAQASTNIALANIYINNKMNE